MHETFKETEKSFILLGVVAGALCTQKQLGSLKREDVCWCWQQTVSPRTQACCELHKQNLLLMLQLMQWLPLMQ